MLYINRSTTLIHLTRLVNWVEKHNSDLIRYKVGRFEFNLLTQIVVRDGLFERRIRYMWASCFEVVSLKNELSQLRVVDLLNLYKVLCFHFHKKLKETVSL